MQERTVLLVVVVLVVSTAGAGVAVNLLRPSGSQTWVAFDLSISSTGPATVGAPMNLTVRVRQGMLDPRTLPVVYLSLDVGTMSVAAASPGTNPWGYRTVWNLTGVDLGNARTYNVTVVPMQAGLTSADAMIWVPLGDLSTVQIDSAGHVNPMGVTVEQFASEPLNVTVAA